MGQNLLQIRAGMTNKCNYYKSGITNNAWNIFQKKGMHFIHLNVNSFLSVIDEICHITNLTNTTVTGLSKIKLGDTVLNSAFEIEGYDLVKFDQSRCGRLVPFL